ncbi:MAG: J domain-containing protein [Desulfobacterales bacterium]
MTEDSFADYYEDLQVSPNADQETIERIYRMLAKRYHPDNGCSGCVDKFDAVTKAFHVLSDPRKRAAYDVRYDQLQAGKWKANAAASPSNGSKEDHGIRKAVLSVLYIERRNNPAEASVGLWRLEKVLGWPEKTIEFHTWYLKEKGWIVRTDNGGYAITAAGVDVLEEVGLAAGEALLLPEKSPAPEEQNERRSVAKPPFRAIETRRSHTEPAAG